MSKFPNSFLKPEVLRQFVVRSQVMGRDGQALGLSTSEVNESFITNKIFNSAWLILISSVDNIDPNESPALKDAGMAKRFILSGGTVIWDGEKLIKRSGVEFEQKRVEERLKAYNLTDSAGLRSMPGITDFSITSTNRWGTIRKASIKFNVWSLDDLELMDKLYFRPGYHIIAEWGHTWGLGKDGKPIETLQSVLDNYNTYFTRGTTPVEINRRIKQSRYNMSLNYDGFLGLITNFSWSFRSDLGYDCSLEIVSRGSILESFTTKSGRPSTDEVTTLGEQAPEDIHKTNFLTQALKIFTRISPPSQQNLGEEKNVWIEQISYELSKKIYSKGAKDFEYSTVLNDLLAISRSRSSMPTFTYDDGTVVSFPNYSYWCLNKVIKVIKEEEQRDEVMVYIPLLVLFYLFNKFLEKTSSSSKIPRFNVRQAGQFLTFDNHITLDPLITALPFAPKKFPIADNGRNTGYIFKTTPLLVVDDEKSSFNLMVTEKCVSEKIFDQLNTEGAASEVNLYELAQGILASMNSALGGINELDLDYDENNNEFVLVDRAMSSVYAFNNKDQILKNPLTVAGLRSIATEFSIVTKISKNLGSMVAIASQGDDSKANLHLGEFKKWNNNLIDRFDLPPVGSINDVVNTIKEQADPPGNVGQPQGGGNTQTPTSNSGNTAGTERPDFNTLSPLEKQIVDDLKSRGITNEYILIAILGNIRKESGDPITARNFSITESGNYKPDRLVEIHSIKLRERWQKLPGNKGKTPSQQELLAYATQLTTSWKKLSQTERDRAFAETVYGVGVSKAVTLGNIKPGDGYKYRGRGPIQLTGRGAYELYGKKVGVDIASNPELLNDPRTGAKVMAEFIKNGSGFSNWNPKNQAEANAGVTQIIAGEPVSGSVAGYLGGLVDKVDTKSEKYYGNKPSPSIICARAKEAGTSRRRAKNRGVC